mgnify:CR=1 FL=1
MTGERQPPHPVPRPPSAVSGAVGLVGLLGLGVWLYVARNFGEIAAALGYSGLPPIADGPYAALTGLAFCGVPMILWSVVVDRVHRRPSTGIDWSLRRPLEQSIDTSIVKLAGLWATWALIALAYLAARWYWVEDSPYPFVMRLYGSAVVPLVLLSIPYMLWIDTKLVEPRDGTWHFGAWIAGRGGWDGAAIAHHLRAWAVKGFFLTFMLSIVPGNFRETLGIDWGGALADPVRLTYALIGLMFVIDVQVATVGYLLTFRPLDSHIRTANPLLAGWVAALICYPPFVLMGNGGPLDYHAATSDWAHWLRQWPALLWLWGGLLVLLTAIYAWATVAFGIRFSNLTHRGILTHGPYRLARHPAYVSKNAFWWCATLPFLVTSGSAVDAVRNTLLLALVSAVYWWRAKTEESHLAADPDYLAYRAWSEGHAPWTRFVARLRRLRPPRDRVAASGHQPAE